MKTPAQSAGATAYTAAIDTLAVLTNTPADLLLARDQHWYRTRSSRPLPDVLRRGQIKWLAFYQTAAFPAGERFCVRYRAPLLGHAQVPYHTLFPDLPPSDKSDQLYHKLAVGPLEALPRPIYGVEGWGRARVLVPTTTQKLLTADSLDDLFHDSPLEDRLWTAIKEKQWLAQRQVTLPTASKRNHVVDFALPTRQGQVVIECDGDSYHTTEDQVKADKARDNALKARNPGWEFLRYTSADLAAAALPATLHQIQLALYQRGGQPDPATGHRRDLSRPDAGPDLFSQPE